MAFRRHEGQLAFHLSCKSWDSIPKPQNTTQSRVGYFFLMTGSVLDHLEVEMFHRASKADKITVHGKSVRGILKNNQASRASIKIQVMAKMVITVSGIHAGPSYYFIYWCTWSDLAVVILFAWSSSCGSERSMGGRERLQSTVSIATQPGDGCELLWQRNVQEQNEEGWELLWKRSKEQHNVDGCNLSRQRNSEQRRNRLFLCPLQKWKMLLQKCGLCFLGLHQLLVFVTISYQIWELTHLKRYLFSVWVMNI